jgi:hypothetical protein
MKGMTSMSDAIAVQHRDDLPPLDSRALDFDTCHELRRTVVDLIRGSEPSTIIGILIRHVNDGVTVEDLARRLDRAPGLIAWNIERLEDEDLCVRTEIDGQIRVLPFAPYTERNE